MQKKNIELAVSVDVVTRYCLVEHGVCDFINICHGRCFQLDGDKFISPLPLCLSLNLAFLQIL